MRIFPLASLTMVDATPLQMIVAAQCHVPSPRAAR